MGCSEIKNKKGFTLSALIITIVVLIIFAAISISVFFDENGILKTSENATDETERMQEKKELALAVSDYWMVEGNLKPVALSRYLQAEPYNYTVKDFDKITEETPKLDVTVRKYSFEVVTDAGATTDSEPGDINDKEDDNNVPGGDNPGGETDDGNFEEIDFGMELTITSHSITVKVIGGNDKGFIYKYYRGETIDNLSEYHPDTEVNYTFTGLTHNTKYYVKVEVTDGKNTATIGPVDISTQRIPDVDLNAITYWPNSETNQNVSITSIYEKGEYSLMYKIDNNEPKEYTEPIIIEENSKVALYMQDTTGQSGDPYELDIDWIDKEKPIITNVEENGSLTDIKITLEDIGSKVEKIAIIQQNSAEPNSEAFINIKENYKIVEDIYDESTDTHTQVININNLVKNRAYFIWVQDSVGNISETYYLYCTVNLKMTEDDIILSTENMVNTNITAQLPVRTGLRTEYKIFYEGEEITEEKINKDNWTLFTSDYIQLTENCTIYCRFNFLDLVKGDYIKKEVSNIDKEAPTIKQVGSSINTATVKCTDNGTAGIDKIGWSAIQVVPKNWFEATEKVEVTVPENSYMYVYLKDKAGNMSMAQVYSGQGIKIEITELGTTDVSFKISSNDERVDILDNDIYWYVGKSEKVPESLGEYVLKQYSENEEKVYTYEEGEDYAEYYVHVRDANGNVGSLKFRLNTADKKEPSINSNVEKYYENNVAQDIRIVIQDELSEIKTLTIYDENKTEIATINVAEVGEKYTDFIKINKSEDLKKVELIVTQVPPTAGYIKAVDAKENESKQQKITFDGDFEEPEVGFTPIKYYKNDEVKLVDGSISIQDELSGLKEITIMYIDKSGQTQQITKTEEELTDLIDIQIPITEIQHDTDLTIIASDNCKNIYNTPIKIVGDFEGPKISLDETQIEYLEDTATGIMYATNSVININDGKSGLASLSIEYIDKNGETQTKTYDNISTADDIVMNKSVTLENFKINSEVTVTTTDNCGNTNIVPYSLGEETQKPTISFSNPSCKIDEDGNKIIEFTLLIEDDESGLNSYTINGETLPGGDELKGKRSTGEFKYNILNNNSLKIEATDICGNTEVFEVESLADNLAPDVEITGSYNYNNKNIEISVRVEDKENLDKLKSGVQKYKISYVLDGQDEATLEEIELSEVKYVVTSQTYTVPNGATVKVTATDNFGNSSGEITKRLVDDLGPTVEIKESYNYNNITISVTVKDNENSDKLKSGVQKYKISYELNGAETIIEETELPELKYEVTSKTHTVPNGATVKVTATDNFGNSSGEITKYVFEGNAPSIQINKSQAKWAVIDDEIYVSNIIVKIDDNRPGVASYTIEYTDRTGTVQTVKQSNINKESTTCTINNIKMDTQIKVTAKDSYGNEAEHLELIKGETQAPTIVVDTNNNKYYKNAQNEEYVDCYVSVSDDQSGLKSYIIEYRTPTDTEYKVYDSYTTSSGVESLDNVKVTVPNDTTIRVTVEDICGNPNTKSVNIADNDPPTVNQGTLEYNSLELINGVIHIEGTITVTDNKSGLYSYKVNDNNWVNIEPSKNQYLKEYKIPFEGNENDKLTIKVKDYFGNESEYSEKLEVANNISIQNINITYNVSTKKISGNVTVSSESGLRECLLKDAKGQTIQTRTSEVQGKTQKVISFNEIENGFYIEVENALGQTKKELIGDLEVPILGEKTKKAGKNENGQLFVDVTAKILEQESGSGLNKYNGSGLYQYKIILGGNEADWQDIPKSSGTYRQEYTIEARVLSGTRVKIYVQDVMGNEAEFDLGVISVENDIEITNIEYTKWDGENKALSGTLTIRAKEKGLKDCVIKHGSTIIGTPYEFNGSKSLERITFSNIPNGSKVIVTNQWDETKEVVLGDQDDPIISITGVEYNIDNKNRVHLKIKDELSGLKTIETLYIYASGPGEMGEPLSYKGTNEVNITLNIPNNVTKLTVIAVDTMNNSKMKEYGEKDNIVDAQGPEIDITVTGYSVELGKKYITGEIVISDAKAGLKSYTVKNGENVIAEGNDLSTPKETVTFKVENDATIVVTSTDNYDNTSGDEQTFSDNEGPIANWEIVEYIKDDSDNKFVKIKYSFEDTKSHLKQYSILIDGVPVGEGDGVIALNNEETYSNYYLVPNNSKVKITVSDNFENITTLEFDVFGDNEKPTANYEIIEYIKDDSDNELVKIKYSFEDTKSYLQQYSILIDGVTVEETPLNYKETYSSYYLVPNNSKVKITVSDNFENITILEFDVNIDSELFPEIIPEPADAVVSPTGWTSEDVTVTLEKHDRFILQYKINNTGDYITYNEPLTVSENCTIEYRYYKNATQEVGPSNSVKISNIDKQAPQVTVTSRNISSIYLNAKDALSGIVKIAVTESKNLPTEQDWIIVSMKSDGSLSGTGLREINEIITDLKFDTTYYAWAEDASGQISEPVEFVTSIKEIGALTYSPTHITNEYVTITLPKDATLKTTYQIVYLDETFDENGIWTEYSEPFIVQENCVIYYRFEHNQDIGNYATFQITNIDKSGPIVDFAIMIDDTLNIEYTEDNNILGYAIKEENVAPTEYEITEYGITKGNKYFTINELTNIETDKSYYIWLVDELGNISAESMEFKKIKIGPNETFKGYTKEAVPVELYIPGMTSTAFSVKFDEGVNQEIKDLLISSGNLVEDVYMDIPITDGSGILSASMPLSATIKFKATVGEKTSREYTIGIHNIDLEMPEIEILEHTITSIKFKAKDQKVGLKGVAVATSDYNNILLYQMFVREDIGSLAELTENEIKNIPNEYTTEEITLTPNTEYIFGAMDIFENTNMRTINTYIETPEGGKYTPENIVNDKVTVQLPTKEYTKLSGEKLKYTTQYRIIIGETVGDWTNYTSTFDIDENCKIEYRYEYEGYYGESAELVINNIDKEGPTTTIKGFNSYSVLINAVDNISGIKGYYISTDSEVPSTGDFIDWGTTEADKLVTNLTPKNTYYAWTIDNVGNISNVVSFETKLQQLGEASLSNSNWTNKDITATLPKDTISTTYTEYQIIYEGDTFNENGEWIIYTQPITISENCVIFYRYNDGNETGQYGTLNVTNIDKVIPTFEVDYVLMDNSIKLTATDEISGISGYILSTVSTGNTLGNKQIQESNSLTISDLEANKTYYVWVVDKATNISENYEKITMGDYEPKIYTSDPITVTLPQIEGYTIKYQIDAVTEDGWLDYIDSVVVDKNCAINYIYKKDTITTEVCTFNVSNILDENTAFDEKGVNPPILSDGMIPIKYDGQNWVVCDALDDEWYDYVDQAAGVDGTSKWANVMLSDGYYKAGEVEVGTTIKENQLGSMFVWIPRYAYAITDGYHPNAANVWGTIKVAFLRGTNNYSAGDAIKYTYRGTKGEAVLSNASGSGNWNEHPAFTFGDEKLTGLWVAKFEASMSGSTDSSTQTKSSNGTYGGTSNILKIQPSVSIWNSVKPSQAFDICYNMNSTQNNIYGINSDKTVADPHLMKNTEYGALVYLTQSSYGRNGNQIQYNHDSSTGVLTTAQKYQIYCSTGYTVSSSGKIQTFIKSGYTSTTGNVTGVYDIANHTYELVSAYLDNESTNTYGDSLKNAASKYVDIYEMGPLEEVTQGDSTTAMEETAKSNYEQNKHKYGDALYEVMSDYTEKEDSSGCESSTGWYIWGDSELRDDAYMNGSKQYVLRGGIDSTGFTSIMMEGGSIVKTAVRVMYISPSYSDDFFGDTSTKKYFEAFRPVLTVY